MGDYQYWTYVAMPGGTDEEGCNAAVAEGRRAFALELAAQSLAPYRATTDEVLDRAEEFETYLKGE